ncbi:hypothetical protein ACT3CD_03385 [Geofilum sp. OHC36d9]|uniref:hypothetical protein n=1 Tax=Geofilum sp. OHC36d9 TaxID=3458413 RepID=UPI0040349FDA
MEKEALIKIVLQDIKELETLVSTFSGTENIPAVYIQLAQSKTKVIQDELSLINTLEPSTSTSKEKIIPTPENKKTPEETVPEAENEIQSEPAPPKEAPKPQAKTTAPITIESHEEEVAVPKETNIVESADEQPGEKAKTPAPAPASSVRQAVIGEVLGKNNKSVLDILADQKKSSDQAYQPSVPDLRKAIGINDRFLFQRELFKGSAELYNQTLDQLNSMQDLGSALSFLKTNFNWDTTSETYEMFIKTVKRRFKND